MSDVISWWRCSKLMHCNRQCVLAAEIAFSSSKSGSVDVRGMEALSMDRARAALLKWQGQLINWISWRVWDNSGHAHDSTHQSSVLCNCCRASPKASEAAITSRNGSISNCDPIDWVWHSAMFRRPSTHSWRARALIARNFKMSPDAQLMVNVRESSSLGQTTAPARCSFNWKKQLIG